MKEPQQHHSKRMWYKNVRAQNFLILALSLVGIMGSVYVFNLTSKISLEEKRQIESEVFSSLVEYLTHHPETNIDYIFLGISGSDPSQEIFNNFKDHVPAVEPISSSRISFGFASPVVHTSDATKRGIQIDLKILDKEPSGYVKVLTSLYQDIATSGRYEYTLDEKEDAYRVIRVRHPERIDF